MSLKKLVFKKRSPGRDYFHDEITFVASCSCGKEYSFLKEFRTAGIYPSSFLEENYCISCLAKDQVHYVVTYRLNRVHALTEILTEDMKEREISSNLVGTLIELPTMTEERLKEHKELLRKMAEKK